MSNIKNIQVGGITYDIEALHFINTKDSITLDTPAQWRDYIDSLVAQGLEIKIDSKSSQGDYPATAASASTMGKLYMVALSGQTESGTYTEFVTVRSGAGTTADPYTYAWEKIGTTAADLSEYAKKGNYTTGGSSGDTGSGGAINAAATSETDLGSATGSAKIDNHSIPNHSHPVNEVTAEIKQVTAWSAGSVPTRASFTYATGAAATGGTATVLTGVKVTGTANVNNDAIKSVTLSASTTSTDGPAYLEDVTHTAASLTGTKTFNTDAIKSVTLSESTNSSDGPIYVKDLTGAISGVTLSESTVSSDGPAYLKSISGSAPSLGGTTSFNTNAIKEIGLTPSTTSTDGPVYVESVSGSAPSLGGTTSFNTNAIKEIALTPSATSTDGPVYVESGTTKYMKLTTTAAGTGTVGISGGSATGTFVTAATTASVEGTTLKLTAAGTGSVSYTAPTLTGTKTFVTAAIGSASITPSDTSTDGPAYVSAVNRKYLKHTNTAADKSSVTISGGSYTGNQRYMKHTTTAADKSAVTISGGSYSGTTRYMKATGDSTNITKTQRYMKAAGNAASTGTVGISGGSITKTTKYMKADGVAASTVTVATAVGANGTATALTSLATASAYQITGVGSVPSLTTATVTVLTPGTTIGAAGATTLTHTGTGSVTVPVTVAIGKHKHTVTVAAHTHSLNGHTHGFTI